MKGKADGNAAGPTVKAEKVGRTFVTIAAADILAEDETMTAARARPWKKDRAVAAWARIIHPTCAQIILQVSSASWPWPRPS